MSCGSTVERRRRRCPECGVLQRGRKGAPPRRFPYALVLVGGVVTALLVAALLLMMFRDRGAGPSRAFEAYKMAATSGRCDEMFLLLTPAARKQMETAEANCRAASGYDWGEISAKLILMHEDDSALVCTDPLHALPMRKVAGEWRVDAPRPLTHPECG